MKISIVPVTVYYPPRGISYLVHDLSIGRSMHRYALSLFWKREEPISVLTVDFECIGPFTYVFIGYVSQIY